MLPIIIAILISIGFINAPTEYYELSAQEQVEATVIVEDIYEF